MSDLEDSIRRQNEEHDATWRHHEAVTVSDGVAAGFYVGADGPAGHVQVEIVESTKPDLFIVGRVYNIPTAEVHRLRQKG